MENINNKEIPMNPLSSAVKKAVSDVKQQTMDQLANWEDSSHETIAQVRDTYTDGTIDQYP